MTILTGIYEVDFKGFSYRSDRDAARTTILAALGSEGVKNGVVTLTRRGW